MTHHRNKLIAASSLLAALIGCGNGGESSPNTATGSGAGAAGGTGGSSGGAGGGGATGGASGSGTGGAGGGSGMTTTGGSAGTGATGGGSASGGGAGVASGSGGVSPMGGAGGATAGSAGTGTSGTSGAGGATGGSAGASTVTGTLTLTIEPNPNSVLSCYVSWKTDAPANSVVQFGKDTYQWEISDDTAVTDHKVLVIGMRSESTYKIKAISGSASGEGTFPTGKPPGQVLNGTVMVSDAATRQPGWTLVNTELGSTADNRPRSSLPPAAVIYDEEGYAVWYFVHGPGVDIGGAVSTQRTDKGVVIGPTWNEQTTNGVPPREVDWAGNVIWECKHAACLPGKNVTHETQKLSNGHYVILEYVGQNPVFRELDSDSKEVWTLDWVKLLPAPSGASGDWCHANAINIDIEKNEVYANCRWIGLMKATYTNPTKQWLIAAKYGKQAGDFTYMPTTSQYSDSHSPDYYDDTNTAIFYDNGGYSGSVDTGAGGTYHSRAVEYKIDTTAKTATLTWEFPGTFATPDDWYQTKWYSPFWGDVDRLPNGNILIAGGMIGKDKPESRVFEVTKADGKVVWELRLHQNIGVYRSERIVPPLVHALTQ